MQTKPAQKYDATFQIGGTTIHIVAPQITEDERHRRLDDVQRVIWAIWRSIETEKIQREPGSTKQPLKP
ncbi:hypothetical protein [Desmospora activa]|uniref:Uncharacterized protein n=1 Tax=Desmospora activa DSM 45169 TaxID=1121389 RepID=A0A2T4ZCI5_9BACL|nr:hypothetical protein [Desmospora activa]PTM59582.1 hypothetical protein C8J48_2209 [Desmospora activa DSM 45169]